MWKKTKTSITGISIVLSILFISLDSFAQTRINSPYSRYGLGDISMTTNARYLGMGSASFGIKDKRNTNFNNPASYVAADTVCFIFEGSVFTKLSDLKTSNNNMQGSYTSLGYLAAQFPVTSWLSASFGLLPYSSVGYEIVDVQNVANVGAVKYIYEGSSGFNRFYIGTAAEIFKGFSVGVNGYYNFGSLINRRSAEIIDSTNYLNVRITNNSIVHDYSFDFGMQYHKEFGEHFLGLGLVYGLESDLKTNDQFLVERYTTGSTSYLFIQDTVEFIEVEDGSIVLPTKLGGGFSVGKKDRWMLAADVNWQNWEKFSYMGERDTNLVNSLQLSIGGEFIPPHTTVSSYFSRIHYRMGFRYGKTYLSLKNQQLEDYGISFGFGLPLRGSASMLNLGFEIGQRGSLDNNLIKESYGRVVFAFNIFERWFDRRKYD